ncbi:MAG: hypothetical protein ACXW4P_04030 [Thermoanaerobaculia bacterium]
MTRFASLLPAIAIASGCALASSSVDTAEAYRHCQYFIALRLSDEKPLEFPSLESIQMGTSVGDDRTVRIVAPYSYTYLDVRGTARTVKAESIFDCSVKHIGGENWNLQSLQFGDLAAP